MSINQETVARIARLARLAIPAPEQAQLAGELERILDWVAQLNAVPTDNVVPMTGVQQSALRWRPDQVTVADQARAVLANAPAERAGFFVVPKVVE